MTPHPAAEAAYWAVLSRTRIGDTATPERHREAVEAYVKTRFGGDPQLRIEVLERMDREGATYVESVICLRSDRFTGEPPYIGWKGLGLALSEDYDTLAAQSARIAELEAEVARLRALSEDRGHLLEGLSSTLPGNWAASPTTRKYCSRWLRCAPRSRG